MENLVVHNLPRKVLILLEEVMFITLVCLAITTVAGATHYWPMQQAKTIIVGAMCGIVGVWGTSIIERIFKIKLGLAVDVFIAVDLILSVVLGEGLQVYIKVNGYDKFLHFIGTLQLALVGYILAKYFLKKTNKGGTHHLAYAIAFGFFFALGVQMIWELYEFTFDMIAGTGMQKYLPDEFMNYIDPITGELLVSDEQLAEFYRQFAGYHYAVEDTMWDVVADICGAAVGVSSAALVFRFKPELQDSLLMDASETIEVNDNDEVEVVENKKQHNK